MRQKSPDEAGQRPGLSPQIDAQIDQSLQAGIEAGAARRFLLELAKSDGNVPARLAARVRDASGASREALTETLADALAAMPAGPGGDAARADAVAGLGDSVGRMLDSPNPGRAGELMTKSMPTLLGIIGENHSAAQRQAQLALKRWASAAPDRLIEAVLRTANPEEREGIPDQRFVQPAVAALALLLPDVVPDVADLLAARTNDRGVVDIVSVTALSNLGDRGSSAVLRRVGARVHDEELTAAMVVLSHMGLKGFDSVVSFCDTRDPDRMANGIRLLGAFAAGCDGAAELSGDGASEIPAAFRDGRVEGIIGEALDMGILSDGGESTKVAAAIGGIGEPAVRPLLLRADRTDDAAEMSGIMSAFAIMGEKGLDQVIGYSDSTDRFRQAKGMLLLGAYAAVVADGSSDPKRRGELARIEIKLRGERAQKALRAAEESGYGPAADFAGEFRRRLEG
jgi:hypothetical protein